MSEMIVKFHCGERGAARSWDEVGKLIRCKDCKHYKSYTIYGQKQGFCNRLGLQAMELDDFCSRAERRSNLDMEQESK